MSNGQQNFGGIALLAGVPFVSHFVKNLLIFNENLNYAEERAVIMKFICEPLIFSCFDLNYPQTCFSHRE